MYNTLKQLIPKTFLKKNESKIRPLVALFYKGNTVHCNLCGFKASKFIENQRGGNLCPKCGSVARARRLWSILESSLKDRVVLHFSPALKLSECIRKAHTKEYITTDFSKEFKADKRLDILDIAEPDSYFDCVICYHILEHIEDDIQAMSELFRILKPNGVCYIQTPFKDGEIYEDPSIQTASERLLHFGQSDHVRIYSVSGLIKRVEHVGFTIERLDFKSDANNVNGYAAQETIIKAQKRV